MNPQFVFKKTNQLSMSEIGQYLDLFFRVFGKKMNMDQFSRKYLCTPTGYSYHGLMVADRQIVGAYSTIPYLYNYFGKEVKFALSVDTMIDERHRAGPFNLTKMAALVYDAMKEDGIDFVMGFPNDNAYDFVKKILKWRDIGELDYYVLPRNIGVIIPKMSFLNIFSRVFAKTKVNFPRLRNVTEYKYSIEKVNGEEFDRHRYDERHSTINLSHEAKCVYTIYKEDRGARVLYIIDVGPLTSEVFEEAVKQAYNVCAGDIDIVIYVGKLQFKPSRLLKVPESKIPRKIRMSGKILNPECVDDRIYSIENWNVNLSNFDVR